LADFFVVFFEAFLDLAFLAMALLPPFCAQMYDSQKQTSIVFSRRKRVFRLTARSLCSLKTQRAQRKK
jgi:hypothetical protein